MLEKMKPVIRRSKNRFEVMDGNKYLGYIEVDKPKNGRVSYDYKYCVGLVYGGNSNCTIADLPTRVNIYACGMFGTYHYRNAARNNDHEKMKFWRDYIESSNRIN